MTKLRGSAEYIQGLREGFTAKLRIHKLSWDYTIVSCCRSVGGFYLYISVILGSLIILLFSLQALFIPKNNAGKSLNNITSEGLTLKRTQHFLNFVSSKKLSTINMFSVHSWLSIVPSFLCLPQKQWNCSFNFRLSFGLCGWGWAGWPSGEKWKVESNWSKVRFWLCCVLALGLRQSSVFELLCPICKVWLIHYNVVGRISDIKYMYFPIVFLKTQFYHFFEESIKYVWEWLHTMFLSRWPAHYNPPNSAVQ